MKQKRRLDVCIFFPIGQYAGHYRIRWRTDSSKKAIEFAQPLQIAYRIWIQDNEAPASKAPMTGSVRLDPDFVEIKLNDVKLARMEAHRLFDELWRSGGMTRNQAYRWLSSELGIWTGDCHFSTMNLRMCLRAIRAIKENTNG